MASKKVKTPMDAESLNKKTVKELKTLCTKLGIKCTGKKADHIDAILTTQAKEEGISKIVLPSKKSKKTKSPLSFVVEIPTGKKKVKKSPRSRSKSPKKSPRSRSKSRSKSPIKKAAKKAPKAKSSPKKTCVDAKNPLICGDEEICSAPSGRCVKDTKVNRHGSKNDKAELLVDGRVIVGTVATITKLEKILGGTITLPGSPAKKATKKKSPAKKSPAKKPAKKAKASPKKTCVDEKNPLICGDEEICSAPSGRCVKDTKVNRYGSKNDKAELLVDGRVIVGTVATITKLEKILGGTITLPGSSAKKTTKKKRTPSPAKKRTPSPAKKRTPSPAKKVTKKKSPAKKRTPSPAKKRTPSPIIKKSTSPKGKEELSPKRTPPKKRATKKKALSPHTLADVEERLNKLIEEGGDHSEIENLKEKLAKLKAGKKSPEKKIKSGKVQLKEQEIYKTFMDCLSSLSAE